MSEKTGIQWCDHTFNPWWGCTKVSPACDHCYAEREAIRFGFKNLWGPSSIRRFFQVKHWNEPLKWNHQAMLDKKSHLVFCGSMCDVLEKNVNILNLAFERSMLWSLIRDIPQLIWLLLTKRPENLDLIPAQLRVNDHVMVGITTENQSLLSLRLGFCQQFDVKPFISIEPMLGPITLSHYLYYNANIPWVIVGGESGPKARVTDPEWVRTIQRECQITNIPFFFKQWGSNLPSGQEEGKLDGVEYHQFPQFPGVK